MLKRKNTWIVLIVLFLMTIASGVQAQKPGKQKSTEKQRKEFLQLQDSREAELAKQMEADRIKHVKKQTKETQKRMKKNKKKVRRLKKGKHEKTFLQRLFTRKSH